MTEPIYFNYGKKETDYLKRRDPILGAAISEIGHIHREVIPDMFAALVHSIIGQQISTKAHATVWARVLSLLDSITPQAVASLSDEELQGCGITFKKAAYIKGIASSVLDGSLDLVFMQTQSDDEIRNRLKQINGIGFWTAEMLMIFSMQRPNVMSFGDLAILRGLKILYHHREITPKLFEKYKRRYSPCATVASLYLWAIASRTKV